MAQHLSFIAADNTGAIQTAADDGQSAKGMDGKTSTSIALGVWNVHTGIVGRLKIFGVSHEHGTLSWSSRYIAQPWGRGRLLPSTLALSLSHLVSKNTRWMRVI